MTHFRTLRRSVFGACAVALLAAALSPAPALGRVTVIVLNENKKAVRSTVSVRVGHAITQYDTESDGTHVFDTLNCTDRTQLKIQPKITLYVTDDKWLSCQPRIILRVRAQRFG